MKKTLQTAYEQTKSGETYTLKNTHVHTHKHTLPPSSPPPRTTSTKTKKKYRKHYSFVSFHYKTQTTRIDANMGHLVKQDTQDFPVCTRFSAKILFQLL